MKNKIFCFHRVRGYLWFRIFWRFGLVIKDVRKFGFLFSERYGYCRFVKFGPYLIKSV